MPSLALRIRADAAARGDAVRADLRAAKRAVTEAVREATTGLKLSLRRQVTGAGLGSRMANAVRGDAYPDKAGVYSFRAAGEVYTKWARKTEEYGLVDVAQVFFEGVTVRSKAGLWLAIPTDAARALVGVRKARKFMSPGEVWKAAGQPLRMIYRRGRPALLVLDNARVSKTGRVRGGPLRRRDGATYTRVAGRTTVIMFILVPQVTLRRRLDGDAAAASWAGQIPDLIATRLDR